MDDETTGTGRDTDGGAARRRKAGLALVAKMLSPEASRQIDTAAERGGFASHMSELALRNVFAEIWTRPALDLRARSLVTLGILIALRAEGELRFHIGIALNNGVSVAEIEEVLYQASAYAGFPAANTARAIADEVLRKAGAIG